MQSRRDGYGSPGTRPARSPGHGADILTPIHEGPGVFRPQPTPDEVVGSLRPLSGQANANLGTYSPQPGRPVSGRSTPLSPSQPSSLRFVRTSGSSRTCSTASRCVRVAIGPISWLIPGTPCHGADRLLRKSTIAGGHLGAGTGRHPWMLRLPCLSPAVRRRLVHHDQDAAAGADSVPQGKCCHNRPSQVPVYRSIDHTLSPARRARFSSPLRVRTEWPRQPCAAFCRPWSTRAPSVRPTRSCSCSSVCHPC